MENHPLRISAERYHSQLMASAERYAWESSGGIAEEFVVLEPQHMDEKIDFDLALEEGLPPLEYESLGSILLPGGSSSIIYAMARFSMASPPVNVIFRNLDMTSFPYETFCLGELLSAAYPRNTRTGIMRGTVGAMYMTGSMEGEFDGEINGQELAKECSMHRMFAGIGIILMRGYVKLQDSILLSDDEILQDMVRRELYLAPLPGEGQ